MDEKEYSSYQFVINELNKLQVIPPIDPGVDLRKLRIETTKKLCNKLDISADDIEKLNIIHIAGTKGKGSTSAFTESILRNNGYKTGLYSSPHLIEVRERIKVNGESISYKKFNDYFVHCHERLIGKAIYESEADRPIYFQFLTCMMFYIFVKEKIDVAVIEVGLGGEYDSTNITSKPVACGITSLGYDHCNILGHTIEEIAWQKAGIFKNGSIGFTTDNQALGALEVLHNRAKEKNIPLCVVKPLDPINALQNRKLSLNGNVQYFNAALAIQLATYWIHNRNGKTITEWISKQEHIKENLYISKPIQLNENFLKGLENCKWPGRNQIIKSKNPNITYYIDGAHTIESVKQYVDWFLNIKKSDNEKNVLLFNYTGDRNGSLFLKELMAIDIDRVAFSKLAAYPPDHPKNNADTIKVIQKDDGSRHDSLIKLFNDIKIEINNNKTIDCKAFTNIYESINWLTNGLEPLISTTTTTTPSTSINNNNNTKINVLITGSLYLVGLCLKVLEYKID